MRVAVLVAERGRFVQSGTAFVAMRAVIGCGLATFVCCQVWCSQQFSKNVVRGAGTTARLGEPPAFGKTLHGSWHTVTACDRPYHVLYDLCRVSRSETR